MDHSSADRRRAELSHQFDHQIGMAYTSRRTFLRRAGIVLVGTAWTPGIIAACSPAASPSSAATAEASTAPTTAASTAPTASPVVGGTLDLMTWEGYDFPEIMAPWREANGVEVNATYMGSHDEIQAKITGGGGAGLDMITYGSSYKPLYSELGILQPLDEGRLANLGNLLPFFGSDGEGIWKDPDGTRTGVPADWGAIGISYDSAVITSPPTSYDILFDSAYTGKVGMPDDPLGAYGQAAHVLGLESSKMTEADFTTISDWLAELIKQTRGVSPSYGDVSTKFVAGDIVLAFMGWAAFKSFAHDAGKDGIETIFPEQGGGLAFSNAWAIPPEADNVDTVYSWIDETLRPEINAASAAFLVGGIVVDGAQALLDPTLASLYPYDDLEGFFAKAPLQLDPPLESTEYVTRDRVLEKWQELKAGA